MKLLIYDNENDKIYQIEISEFDMLNDIYGKLVNNEKLTLSDFYGKVLIYKNIIISGKRINGKHYGKIIKFYKIHENDEIWFGKIGNYLTENHVILEVYTSELGDFIIIIMNKTDQISQLKLIVEKYIGKIVSIWKIDGTEIHDEEIIDNIDFCGKYCRVVIGSISNSKIFNECCKFCEEYLLDYLLREVFELRYWHQFIDYDLKFRSRRFIEIYIKCGKILLNEQNSFLLWFYKYFDDEKYKDKLDEIGLDQCRLRIIEAKKEILSNSKYDYKLPAEFINSRLLFCMHLMDIIGEMFMSLSKSVGHLLRISLQLAVFTYTNENRLQLSNDDKPMKTILIEMFNCIENVFIHLNDNLRFWVKLFFNQFLFRVYADSEIDDLLHEYLNPGIESFCININGKPHQLYAKYPKTLFDMKKAISYKTGLPIKNFYFMNYKTDKKPKDDDEYNDNFFREIEFISGIDEVDILEILGKGAFGQVLKCKSKSSGKTFVLKKPLGENSDLFREINIQYRFKFSKILSTYLKLFDSDGTICLAMPLLSEVITDIFIIYIIKIQHKL